MPTSFLHEATHLRTCVLDVGTNIMVDTALEADVRHIIILDFAISIFNPLMA